MLTDIVSVMNVISVSAVRINGGTVCCAVVADICRVPVSFYMAAAGGKHGQQTDQDGFFQHFRSPLAADFASHNFNTPLNGVFKVFFRQTAGQITDIIVGDRQTAVFVGPGRCFRGKSVHCLDQLPGFGNADAAAVGKKQFFDFSAAVTEAFQMNMTGEELAELMMSMGAAKNATYDNNLKQLGYVDFAVPTTISIYPKDFESKEEVVRILDDYNRKMEEQGKEEQVITYTDMVGALMSSVTQIIDVISYVLVAFVAISLIVSSIMIGVITYISVLERKKEIGILRAIGASKSNISQVFNAETFIIGLCAGVIGIGITLLLLIPGNALIHHLAGTNDVSAVLPVIPAIILIILSVILTLLGGLLPSKKAAKSDPVTALRTE